ncbi:unnamed protein product [Protopolystoma xenopodis]|uniref:Uncharacterized protein n=1 Tax=Protopolystoma xenopodis TaxID=117903 RepID=A0A3S5B543_9PLAT|nr:unnamed protein product [Protopolystoma xenopodis]
MPNDEFFWLCYIDQFHNPEEISPEAPKNTGCFVPNPNRLNQQLLQWENPAFTSLDPSRPPVVLNSDDGFTYMATANLYPRLPLRGSTRANELPNLGANQMNDVNKNYSDLIGTNTSQNFSSVDVQKSVAEQNAGRKKVVAASKGSHENQGMAGSRLVRLKLPDWNGMINWTGALISPNNDDIFAGELGK